ncbi:hypothetical protein GW17_00009158 [Ensete ventricosum]|nr:hypothetical protein GW17_00009158 [Ensete ventricosum]
MAAVERPGKKAHRPRLLVAEAPPTTDAFSRDAKMTVDVPRGGAHLGVYFAPSRSTDALRRDLPSKRAVPF